ncbi:uncharacterized protein SPAPADRAFT_150049 [Spathaspora passalidarum NRRL Y-27907]|uniref:Dynactin subunit 5 n=1 Tax=Spathaspora passalidarum (strain NRRL Y-27907 / 11-Y1) TaxID=619300 RepID=G3AMF5_SPAPN|nr:uncharacterized protein SPAPADRAFT_150049 [Spathaspora passalidarum NRRL Y-27907]EGW32806.1 hypothetical protein SPAPADRAFT_150049 [Spathaspora passalidarum NRRL Y-27907]
MSYIETSSGNRISQDAKISGTSQISIESNCTISHNVILQGDTFTSESPTIQLGKYCYLDTNCRITPETTPVTIGSYVIIGVNTTVHSSTISNRVIIEGDCTIATSSVIYDCCIIRKGTVIPNRLVIPPYSEVSGVPGKDFAIRKLHPSFKKLIEIEAKQLQILG